MIKTLIHTSYSITIKKRLYVLVELTIYTDEASGFKHWGYMKPPGITSDESWKNPGDALNALIEDINNPEHLIKGGPPE